MSLPKLLYKKITKNLVSVCSFVNKRKFHLNDQVMANSDKCIFCKIVSGKDEMTDLIYQDDKFAVFSDIHPAANHHFLVCPREHITDAKVLTQEHVPLVEKMVNIGKQVLSEKSGGIENARFGFHWPPFCSIHHLHLHVISPVTSMRTFPWMIGMFSPSMPWFRSVEWVLERMRSIPGAGDKSDS